MSDPTPTQTTKSKPSNILWSGPPGVLEWRLGDHTPPSLGHNGSQELDLVWKGGEDHIDRLRTCDHYNKIQVNGSGCVELAERLLAFLQAGPAPDPKKGI